VSTPEIRLDEKFRGLGGFIAYSAVNGVKNGVGKVDVGAELADVYGNIDSLREDPVVRAYRDFYWKIGIDPTKVRPSGEALRRRVLRGQRLPRINDLVDIGNIVSTRTLVPIGIYDMRFLKFPLILTVSLGDKFLGIGKGEEEEILPDGIPVMKDGSGKVVHVFPHRDSRVTSVREDTSEALIVGAGVNGVPSDLVVHAVDSVISYIEKFLFGRRVMDTVILS